MRIVVVHDRYNNTPIVIVRPNMISIVRKAKERDKEYTIIFIEGIPFEIKETVEDVINKIKSAERRKNERKNHTR